MLQILGKYWFPIVGRGRKGPVTTECSQGTVLTVGRARGVGDDGCVAGSNRDPLRRDGGFPRDRTQSQGSNKPCHPVAQLWSQILRHFPIHCEEVPCQRQHACFLSLPLNQARLWPKSLQPVPAPSDPAHPQ